MNFILTITLHHILIAEEKKRKGAKKTYTEQFVNINVNEFVYGHKPPKYTIHDYLTAKKNLAKIFVVSQKLVTNKKKKNKNDKETKE